MGGWAAKISAAATGNEDEKVIDISASLNLAERKEVSLNISPLLRACFARSYF